MLDLNKVILAGSERMNKEQGNNQQNDRKTLGEDHPIQVVYDGNAVKNNQEKQNIHVFQRPEIKRKPQKKRFMPVLLTVLCASAIGVFFGMTILKLFVSMDDEPIAEGNHTDETVTASAASGSTEKKHYDIPQLSGYVLQAGVFMEKENAEEWLNYYETNQLPVIIWEQDTQYYLFTGIYPTEEAAKNQAGELKASGYDVFAKSWSTTSGEIELGEEEAEWLNKFAEEWPVSLSAKKPESLIESVNAVPSSEQFAGIRNKLQEQVSAEQFYLDIFKLYEQLGKDI